MIKQWIITGDTHGQNETRLGNIHRNVKPECAEETAVIILGDAGYNFYLNKTDKKHKKNTCHMWVYCVRGNHEERPENLEYPVEYDENVQGQVYVDPVNSKIRYFVDGGEYVINGHSVLVIGGAYSVDKWWRLQRAAAAGHSFSGWFEDEQLTVEEMAQISSNVKGKHFDFVFSHTCPIGWEPNDLFLNCVNQDSVDKSMELWLDELKDTFDWSMWCFGHYHADRLERPHVEQFYMDYEDMETVWGRWYGKEPTIEKEWWIPKSPNYYMGMPITIDSDKEVTITAENSMYDKEVMEENFPVTAAKIYGKVTE